MTEPTASALAWPAEPSGMPTHFPWRLIAGRIGAILFLAEFGIMLLLPNIELLANPWLMLLFDATLLSLIAAGLSHTLVFQPLLASHSANITHHVQRMVVLGTVLVKSAVVIFTVEGGIMLVLRVVNIPHEGLTVSLVNAVTLTLAATPVMVFWIAPGMKYGKRSRISHTLPSFLVLLLPTALIFISLLMSFYHAEVDNKQRVLESETQNHLAMLATTLTHDLLTASSDLSALSRQSSVTRLLQGDVTMGDDLQQDWQEFLITKQAYPWLLLTDTTGREWLKVVMTEPHQPMPTPRLPDLRPMMSLANGGIHLFPPQEKAMGTAEDDFILIFATPIFHGSDALRGVLSLALSCRQLFAHIRRIRANRPETLFVINEQDTILFQDAHYADVHATSLATLFPDTLFQLEAAKEGQFRTEQGLFTFVSLPLIGQRPAAETVPGISRGNQTIHNQPHLWRLVTFLPRVVEEKNYLLFRENILLLAMVMAPVLMLGVWLFIRTVVNWNRAESALEEHANKLEQIIGERTRQLVRADRMATMGGFSAGMAHEINDPNAFIAGNVHFLKLFWEKAHPILLQHMADDHSGRIRQFLPEIQDILDGILVGSQRITRIVESLKFFAKPRSADFQMELCRLHVPIEQASRILKQESDRIHLELNIPDDLVVLCDRQELTQAFIHLFRNALEAVSDLPAKRIAVSARVAEQGVCIRFEDNGQPIPEPYLHQIFDPFSPVARRTQGFGLVLPIVQGIVEEHHGRIEAVPCSQGAAFHIHLPVPGMAPVSREKDRNQPS